jgi:hypothetical protein
MRANQPSISAERLRLCRNRDGYHAKKQGFAFKYAFETEAIQYRLYIKDGVNSHPSLSGFGLHKQTIRRLFADDRPHYCCSTDPSSVTE